MENRGFDERTHVMQWIDNKFDFFIGMFSSNFGFFGRASFTTCSKHRDFGKAQNYGRTFNYRPRRGTTGFSPTAGVRRHRQHVAERRQRPLPLVFVFCLRSRLQHVAERGERLLLLGSSSSSAAGAIFSTSPRGRSVFFYWFRLQSPKPPSPRRWVEETSSPLIRLYLRNHLGGREKGVHSPFGPPGEPCPLEGGCQFSVGRSSSAQLGWAGEFMSPLPTLVLRARPHLGRFCPFVRISVRGRAPFPYSGRKSGKEGSVFCLSTYRKEMPTISWWENSNSESRRSHAASVPLLMVPLFLHH